MCDFRHVLSIKEEERSERCEKKKAPLGLSILFFFSVSKTFCVPNYAKTGKIQIINSCKLSPIRFEVINKYKTINIIILSAKINIFFYQISVIEVIDKKR